MAVQSCVYREYRSGLRTQPCGAPVLRIKGDEVYGQILRFRCTLHAADCVAITVLERCSPGV